MIKKLSKKKKEEIILPGARYIYQSNRITNGRFPDFNMYHIKIFVCLIKQLQQAIQADMDGKQWQQLGLFEEVDTLYLKIAIPLSEISIPQHYKEVIEAFEDIRKISYKIESPFNKGYILHTGLIESFDAPKKENGKNVIYVKIHRDVAKEIVTITKNNDGKPISFTRYLYDVVMNSRSKYTWKVYSLISSWKVKGGFNISLEEFRSIIGIKEEEYLNYSDLKRFVILPAHRELDHKSDCWFNCSERGFEEKKGKKVIGLRFKVISPALEELALIKKHQAHQFLRTNANFKASDLEAISAIFTTSADYGAILGKIWDLIDYIKLHAKDIGEPKRYIIAALVNAFAK